MYLSKSVNWNFVTYNTVEIGVFLASAVLSIVVAFAIVYFVTPLLIKYLNRTGSVVVDVMKPGTQMVARPAGPVLLLGILVAGSILYAFFESVEILAVLLVAVACFVVGYIDDRKVMGGWFKPIALAVCAAPILFLGAYEPSLSFPIFGETNIPLLYFVLAPLLICITGNTTNSIDVMNGLLSGFMAITGAALSISLVIVQNYEMAIMSLLLVSISLAYYKYHKIPCKIFPGDSGSLVFGGMYGAIAMCGGVEVIAAVALLPAIINSFLFLASVKKIVEYRKVAKKSTVVLDDYRIKCSSEKGASISLVGLVTGTIPHTEMQVVFAIFKLAALSGGLAVLTAVLTVWNW